MTETSPRAASRRLRLLTILAMPLLLVGSALWLLRAPSTPAPLGEVGSVDPGVAAATVLQAEGAAGAGATPGPGADEPAPGRRAVPEAVASGRPPTITGVCVDESGAALVDAQVRLTAVSPVDAVVPAPRRVDAGGAFSIEVQPATLYRIEVTAPQRVPLVGSSGKLDPGRVLALGTVALHRGRIGRVAVVGEDGSMQPGVILEIADRRRRLLQHRLRPESVHRAATDAAGVAYFDVPVRPSSWHLRMYSHKPKGSTEFDIEDQPGPFTHEVMVEARAASRIYGRVIDGRGAPLRARVLAFRDGAPALAFADSTEEGRFEIRRPAGDDVEDPVRLRVEVRGTVRLETQRAWKWGSEVQLTASLATALEVAVVDTELRPVRRFSLYVFPPRSREFKQLRARSSGAHPDGVARVGDIDRGPNVLLVRAEDRGLVQDGLPRVAAAMGQRVRVQLDRAVERRVRVVDSSGRPVAGASVELILPLDERPIGPATPASDLFRLYTLPERAALLHDTAITSPRGRATVAGHPRTEYALRVTAPDYVPFQRPIVLATLPLDAELVLSRGARIEGRLGPARAVELLARLRGVQARAKPRLSPDSGRVERAGVELTLTGASPGGERRLFSVSGMGNDGVFAFANVPPGEWGVELSWRQNVLGQTSVARQRRVLGMLGVAGGGSVVHVAYDLFDLPLGELRGRVEHNGEPFSGWLVLRPADADPDQPGPRLSVRKGDVSSVVGAGRWAISAAVRERVKTELRFEFESPLDLETVVEVAPLGAATLDLRFGDGVLRGTVARADGAPAAGHVLVARVPDGPSLKVTINKNGSLRHRLLPGTYTATLRASDDPDAEPIDLGTFRISPARTTEVRW